MSQARDILREYHEQRRTGAGENSSDAQREENLRRLLRHVAVAHQPSERFEASLMQAMMRAGQAGTRPRRRWLPFARPAWQAWAPALTLAAVAVAFAWHFRVPHSTVKPISTERAARPASERGRSGFQQPARAAPVIGYVLIADGELLRQPAGSLSWERVQSDDPIHLGDTVRTDASASGSVVFRDESVNRVFANTTLQYAGAVQPDLKRPSQLILSRGETWNAIEKGGPLFEVRAPAATAIVHGTHFSVSVGARGKTTLRVEEGKVELRNALASVFVRTGMQSVALVGYAPQTATPLTPTAAPGVKPGPATLHRAPPAGKAAKAKDMTPGPAKSEHSLRSTPPSTKPDLAVPPDAPAQPPGSPTSTSGDAGVERPAPISTSR